MSNAKVLINTHAGTIELEGEDSFVRTYLDKLIPIIERAPFGKGPSAMAGSDARIVEAGPPKSRTRRTTQTPVGESCRDRVKKLRDDGFFSERRGISEIVQGLGAQGHVHNVNQVGAALTTMFERGEILRAPVEGKFKYHWDASARTAAA
jgi:hypothetical protein